jgi:hypothetical protein
MSVSTICTTDGFSAISEKQFIFALCLHKYIISSMYISDTSHDTQQVNVLPTAQLNNQRPTIHK